MTKKSSVKFVELEELKSKHPDKRYGVIIEETKENFTGYFVEESTDADDIQKESFDKDAWKVVPLEAESIKTYFKMALLKSENELNNAEFNLIHAKHNHKKSCEWAKEIFGPGILEGES